MTIQWFIVCALGVMVVFAAVEWIGSIYEGYKVDKELKNRLRDYIGRPNENEGDK